MTPPSPPLSRLLEQAAEVVHGVRAGRSATELLALCPAELRAGTQALAFQALRRLGGAAEVRRLLVPKTPPPAVEALLLTALALLWPSAAPPYPEHTLVDQAVAAVRRRQPQAAGFVNAVLRRFVRERAACVEQARQAPQGAWDHPTWWVERLRRDWPQHWAEILESAREHPPLTLRVNARQCSGADYLRQLAEAGREAVLLPGPLLAGQAVVLARPCPVQQLPGFDSGRVSVQDAAAQCAASLLLGPGLPAGARVLDACAAPGGKTAQLLERAELDLLALDSDPARLARVHETLQRLQLRAEVRAGDAREPAAWWDGRPFDAILLDAPCSASGIVRRHPDIRWLRRPKDIDALAQVQGALLDALWPLLAPGGRLLYATCSVFKAEGADVIDAFLQRLPPGTCVPDPTAPGHLLPLADNSAQPGPPLRHDGFFYALLQKP